LREVRIAHANIPGMTRRTSAANTAFMIRERVIESPVGRVPGYNRPSRDAPFFT
jgi:hypothetical protein